MMLLQMRMATFGHNNTLWRFIVTQVFPFVNGFLCFLPRIFLGFFALVTKISADSPFGCRWISFIVLNFKKETLAFFRRKCYSIPEEVNPMEWNDVYDADRNLTGRRHLRGESWGEGEYGLAVCCWVYDGRGNVLLTQRAPEKSFPLSWENSGGAAQAGETSRQAMRRELFEETGITAEEEEFEFLETTRNDWAFFDHYCICRQTPLEQIVLQPGETSDAKWVSLDEACRMAQRHEMCQPIRQQFLHFMPMLRAKQTAQV